MVQLSSRFTLLLALCLAVAARPATNGVMTQREANLKHARRLHRAAAHMARDDGKYHPGSPTTTYDDGRYHALSSTSARVRDADASQSSHHHSSSSMPSDLMLAVLAKPDLPAVTTAPSGVSGSATTNTTAAALSPRSAMPSISEAVAHLMASTTRISESLTHSTATAPTAALNSTEGLFRGMNASTGTGTIATGTTTTPATTTATNTTIATTTTVKKDPAAIAATTVAIGTGTTTATTARATGNAESKLATINVRKVNGRQHSEKNRQKRFDDGQHHPDVKFDDNHSGKGYEARFDDAQDHPNPNYDEGQHHAGESDQGFDDGQYYPDPSYADDSHHPGSSGEVATAM